MVTKLNSYSLTDDIVIRMRQKIEETKQKKIELGFGLCHIKPADILKTGEECTGDQCSILPMTECPTGVYIGGFHTHPKGGTQPSIADLRNAYINDLECVGAANNDRIRCFVRIGTRKPEDEQNIKSLEEEVETSVTGIATIEQYNRWRKARDEIWNKHFQTVTVQ